MITLHGIVSSSSWKSKSTVVSLALVFVCHNEYVKHGREGYIVVVQRTAEYLGYMFYRLSDNNNSFFCYVLRLCVASESEQRVVGSISGTSSSSSSSRRILLK